MKKIIKTTIFAIALALLPMASQAENKTPQTGNKGKEVKLERLLYPIKGNNGSSRAPIYSVLPLQVFYDEDASTLIFSDSECDEISFAIYDSDGTIVMQDICIFNDEGEYSISLDGLSAGIYSVSVILNGSEYRGVFEISE